MPILRKLELKDAEKMLSWMHDDSVNIAFNKPFKQMSIIDCERFINNQNYDIQNIKNKKFDLHFAITNGVNDEYLGTVSLKNIDTEKKNAEFAIVLIKDARGKGYAEKAYNEILNYAYNVLKLEDVYFSCRIDNIIARKFYKKMGAKHIGDILSNDKFSNFNNKFNNVEWYIC